MARSTRPEDDAELRVPEAAWADAFGTGDVFDPTNGWIRGYIIDLCNLRPAPPGDREEAASLDLIGGLVQRLLSWVRNG